MVRFQPLVVNDRLLGQEAFRVLIPADWRGEGGVFWRFHPQYPAGLAVRAYNPTGLEAIHSYPMLPFVDGIRHLRQGQFYLGNEFRPYPGDIAGYVRLYLLPRFRPDVRDYRIVAVEGMTEWAKTSTMGQAGQALRIPYKVQASRVRIAYTVKDRPVEEEFYVMLDSLFMIGLHYWGAEWATSVRAEAGKLDPVRRIQLTMASSLQMSLPWYSRERQAAAMCEQLLKHEQVEIMKISGILARTNEHVSDTIRRSYESRQATLDRVHERFSEYIRGVDTYRGADGRRIQLPSGYRQAWVNNRGEHVLSNDANFNPNVQLGGDWRRLQPLR